MRKDSGKSPVARWLKRVRVELDMKQTEFGDALGVTGSLIGMMENGVRAVSPQFVSSVLNAFGDQITEDPPQMGDIKVVKGDTGNVSSVVRIKYAGVTPCSDEWGDPLESTETREIDAKFAGPGRFETKAGGDSGWPFILQGDRLVWETDIAPTYSLVVLAQLMDTHGCLTKQLVWDEKAQRPRLKSLNPAVENPPDLNGWQTIAKLVGVIRRHGVEKTWYNPDGLRPEDLK
jgi:transcriptional regulator with XRE-family HTH domain